MVFGDALGSPDPTPPDPESDQSETNEESGRGLGNGIDRMTCREVARVLDIEDLEVPAATMLPDTQESGHRYSRCRCREEHVQRIRRVAAHDREDRIRINPPSHDSE